jgi:hypothetical protein
MKSNSENLDAYVDGASRAEILERAGKLVSQDRQRVYGPAEDNFNRIAKGWSVLLGVDVTPAQVGLCMAWLKMCRLVHTPQDLEGYVDGSGYMAISGELAKAVGVAKDDA